MIKQFIKDKKSQKVGVMIGQKIDNEVIIGVSKVNCSAGDVFNKSLGENIAEHRILKYAEHKRGRTVPPTSVRPQLSNFIKRCERYYKTLNITVV